MNQNPWDATAVGLLAIATALAGVTAVGGFEIAVEFGTGGTRTLNEPTRRAVYGLFAAAIFMYVIAWVVALYVISGDSGWAKTNTRNLAISVFLQSLSVSLAALVIVIATLSESNPVPTTPMRPDPVPPVLD